MSKQYAFLLIEYEVLKKQYAFLLIEYKFKLNMQKIKHQATTLKDGYKYGLAQP
ncbi:hypothetical protein [Nostoc sp.]|uniref:hypothetical protein n=1 Tax=Nostoc sp. TaxID=1180 RepID=UPI002FF556E2